MTHGMKYHSIFVLSRHFSDSFLKKFNFIRNDFILKPFEINQVVVYFFPFLDKELFMCFK